MSERREFLHTVKGLTSDDRLAAIIAHVSLVIYNNKRLLSQFREIRDNLELQVRGRNILGNTFCEGYCGCNISQEFIKVCSEHHFAWHAIQCHSGRFTIFYINISELKVTSFASEREVKIVLIHRDVVIFLGVCLVVRTQHYNLDIGSAVTIIIKSKCTLGKTHRLCPSTPVSVLALHLLYEVSITFFSGVASTPSPVIGTKHSIFKVLSLVTKDEQVVEPVARTATIVKELYLVCLARFSLDVIGENSPPRCCIIGISQRCRIGYNGDDF